MDWFAETLSTAADPVGNPLNPLLKADPRIAEQAMGHWGITQHRLGRFVAYAVAARRAGQARDPNATDRIRVDITSSDFPNFDRNHNTGGDDYQEARLEVARNNVFHDRQRPSSIELPMI